MASNPKIISVVDRHGNHHKEKAIHQEDFKAKLLRFATQGKQPSDVAMTHPNILGEVYDQLQHLHSIFLGGHPSRYLQVMISGEFAVFFSTRE